LTHQLSGLSLFRDVGERSLVLGAARVSAKVLPCIDDDYNVRTDWSDIIAS